MLGVYKPNLENEKQVIDAYNQIIENAKRYNPECIGAGCCCTKKWSVKELKLSLGLKEILNLDRLYMFGVGGILVELFKDISLRLTSYK